MGMKLKSRKRHHRRVGDEVVSKRCDRIGT